MKYEQFTDEEIKTVEKAKDQISSYAKSKNFKGIQGIAIATGGLLIGSQIGLIMGAMSSLRTIQSIPNFQRVMQIVQERLEENKEQQEAMEEAEEHFDTIIPLLTRLRAMDDILYNIDENQNSCQMTSWSNINLLNTFKDSKMVMDTMAEVIPLAPTHVRKPVMVNIFNH
ncbi:hypothetical protein BG004_000249 [Podila humilis]|nr:hypothetical protein BG004_000249 [Podila humilis]